MKKVILGLIIVVLLIFVFNTDLSADARSSFSYRWENTVIHIPLNDELTKYERGPVAYLYENNVLLDDAKVEYQRDGDWLYFLKDVDTSKVGNYYVWYKAYEYQKYKPGTCTGYKCKITFIVEDKIPPKLSISSSEVSIRRQKENDLDMIESLLLNNVKATDNYKDISVTFNHHIDLRFIGKYKVEVFAYDLANNVSKGLFYFNVFDDSIPLIYFDMPNDTIKINRNDEVNIKEYFKATDEVDGDITDKIIFPVIDNQTLGKTTYKVSVRNSAGNMSTRSFIVEIVDDIKPELLLTTDVITLDYQTDFNSLNLNKYILSINDDMPIDYNNLIITDNLENKVGVYFINYTYFDGVNKDTKTLEVRLVSYKGPTLEIDDAVIKIGDYVDLNDYVTVTDLSDFNAKDNLVISDDEVNYNEAGTYYATAYCLNSSGMSTTKKIKILVEEEIKKSNVAIIILSISLGLILLIILGVLIFYFIKVKKKKEA